MSDARKILLYLAVPFCPKKCDYCTYDCTPFRDTTLPNLYAQALRKEIEYAASDYADCEIQAVWVGGGIATHMMDEQLGDLLRDMRKWFRYAPDAQTTVKSHPGMVSAETLDCLHRGRVEQLSIEGITSISSESEPLGRYLSPDAMRYTALVTAHAPLTMSMDVLTGLPGQTPGTVVQTLKAFREYGAKAFRLIPMRLCTGTVYAAWAEKNKDSTNLRKHLPTADECVAVSKAAEDWLKAEGYIETIPGVYALPGCENRFLQLEHRGMEVVGFGAGAESVFDGIRSCNTANVAKYINASPDPRKLIESMNRI